MQVPRRENAPTPPSAVNPRNNLVPPSQSTGDCKKKNCINPREPTLSPIIPIHSALPTLASSTYRNRRRGRESLSAGRGNTCGRITRACVHASAATDAIARAWNCASCLERSARWTFGDETARRYPCHVVATTREVLSLPCQNWRSTFPFFLDAARCQKPNVHVTRDPMQLPNRSVRAPLCARASYHRVTTLPRARRV